MTTTSPTKCDHPPGLLDLLIEVIRHGLVLKIVGDQLHYHPKSAMTADLVQQIKPYKPLLLTLLRDGTRTSSPTDKTSPHVEQNRPVEQRSGVSSVLAVSEQPKGLWSEEELALLAQAGKTPADLPLVTRIKDVFADLPGGGATVVSIKPSSTIPSRPRQQVARLIRKARREGQHNRAMAMRHTWNERLTACMMEGDLSLKDAESIALAEIEVLDSS